MASVPLINDSLDISPDKNGKDNRKKFLNYE